PPRVTSLAGFSWHEPVGAEGGVPPPMPYPRHSDIGHSGGPACVSATWRAIRRRDFYTRGVALVGRCLGFCSDGAPRRTRHPASISVLRVTFRVRESLTISPDFQDVVRLGRAGEHSKGDSSHAPILAVTRSEDCSVQYARKDPGVLTETLNASRHQSVIFPVGKRRCAQPKRESIFVEPLGNTAVDRDFVAREREGLQEVAGLLRTKALKRIIDIVRNLSLGFLLYRPCKPIAMLQSRPSKTPVPRATVGRTSLPVWS